MSTSFVLLCLFACLFVGLLFCFALIFCFCFVLFVYMYFKSIDLTLEEVSVAIINYSSFLLCNKDRILHFFLSLLIIGVVSTNSYTTSFHHGVSFMKARTFSFQLSFSFKQTNCISELYTAGIFFFFFKKCWFQWYNAKNISVWVAVLLSVCMCGVGVGVCV